jgi:hypothetical protein
MTLLRLGTSSAALGERSDALHGLDGILSEAVGLTLHRALRASRLVAKLTPAPARRALGAPDQARTAALKAIELAGNVAEAAVSPCSLGHGIAQRRSCPDLDQQRALCALTNRVKTCGSCLDAAAGGAAE